MTLRQQTFLEISYHQQFLNLYRKTLKAIDNSESYIPPMAARGRGGARGGRGGARGGARGPPGMNWGDDLYQFVSGTPQEKFPDYEVRAPIPQDETEKRIVNRFLLFRRHVHDGPLYTRARTSNNDPSAPTKAYDRDQINDQFKMTSKATVDPFTCVPTYGNRFKPSQRTLPLLSQRPFNKKFFPAELHDTLEGHDLPGKKHLRGATNGAGNSSKKLTLSTLTAVPGITSESDEARKHMLDLLARDGDGDDDDINDLELNLQADMAAGEDGEGGPGGEDMDDDYEEEDDEDGNDYNAQEYWEAENNDDVDDYDGGGGGDDGDVY